MPISVDFICKSGIKIDRKEIRKMIRWVLAQKGVSEPVELSIMVVDGEQMIRLHEQYLKTPEKTDVISFPTEEVTGPDGVRRLGDIVICSEFIEKSDDAEVLAEHGLRHLLGEHHEENEE